MGSGARQPLGTSPGSHSAMWKMLPMWWKYSENRGAPLLLRIPPRFSHPRVEIELSHESLIGIWDRLQDWVDEEADSINMYLRLSEASALYQQGRTELWKPPELQVALNWRDSQNPTPAWGVQYNPAFERAMVFLTTSEEEYLWDEERKVILQRRRLILNRAIAVFMGALVVVLTVVFFGTRNRTPDAGEANQMTDQDYSYVPDYRPSTPATTEEVILDPGDEFDSDPESGCGADKPRQFE